MLGFFIYLVIVMIITAFIEIKIDSSLPGALFVFIIFLFSLFVLFFLFVLLLNDTPWLTSKQYHPGVEIQYNDTSFGKIDSIAVYVNGELIDANKINAIK